MQAAEREQVHLQSSGDQWLTAVTAESDLIDQAGVQGPLQQGPALSTLSPREMLRSVDPVDGQIVDPLHLQPSRIPCSWRFPCWSDTPGSNLLVITQSPVGRCGLFCRAWPRKRSRGAAGRRCFQVVDARLDGGLQNLRHLIDRSKGTHGAEAEQADGAASSEGPSHSALPPASDDSVSASRPLRWRTSAAGLSSSTKRLKSP